MRKHRIIGFVLAVTTVSGPISLYATAPASASVVVNIGARASVWRAPLVKVPISARSALPRPGTVATRSTPRSTLFAEFGRQPPLHLGGIERQLRRDATRLAAVQLDRMRRTAFFFTAVRLAAATAAARSSAPAADPPASAPAPVVTVSAPPGDVWAALRECESGGNYAEDTGNGFYGAYQFAAGTWTDLGYSGLPSDAPPAVQDAAAQQLQARSGWGQWPGCSATLGL